MKWTMIAVYSPDFVPIASIMSDGERFFLVDLNKTTIKENLDQAMEGLMNARFVN